MGEVLILIIIALVWVFKAAVANEDKKVNDRETGSISSTPDELIKKAKRTAEDLDALRGQTEKKRPEPAGDQGAPQAAPRRRVGEKRAAPRR